MSRSLVAAIVVMVASDQASAQPVFNDDRQLPGFGQMEAQRLKAEEDERQRLAAEAEQTRKAEEAQRLKAEEDERQRLAAEAEQTRKAEEAQRLKAEEDERQRLAAEAEQTRREVEAQRLAEEDARRLAAAEVQRRLALEARQKSDAEATTEPQVPQRQAAIETPAPAAAATTGTGRCPAAGSFSLETAELPAGRIQLDISSECRAGERVSIRYGDHTFNRTLDADGKLGLVLDLFLGTSQSASVVFADTSSAPLALPAGNLSGLSKVALIWTGPIDLDLHAFEYVATRGGKGHVSALAPSSAEAIASEIANGGKRGRGFISSSSEGTPQGESLEVYTFIHAPDQVPGIVRFEVDYATRGDTPSGETCGAGKYAELDYTVIQLLDGREAKRERLRFSSLPCGIALDAIQRHLAYTIGDLRIRR